MSKEIHENQGLTRLTRLTRLTPLATGTVAALVLGLTGCAEPPMVVVHPDGTVVEVVDCNRGCNAPTPDETHTLSEAEYRAALVEVAQAPVGADTLGVDTLLFHFAEFPELAEQYGTEPLSEEHLAWVQTELSRQTVDIEFRFVGGDGAVLGELRQDIPLKIKQHLVLRDTGPLKRVGVNGKTKRVGLRHLWSRF